MVEIAAAPQTCYKILKNGQIWRHKPVQNPYEISWELIDKNSSARHIVCSGSGKLYQVQKNGAVWEYNGSPYCWHLLIPGDSGVTDIVAGSTNELYQLRNDGKIFKLIGDDDWLLISDNSQTKSIYAVGTDVYQTLKNLSILKCVGTSAGLTLWQALDSMTEDTTKFVAAENGTVWQCLKNGACMRWESSFE